MTLLRQFCASFEAILRQFCKQFSKPKKAVSIYVFLYIYINDFQNKNTFFTTINSLPRSLSLTLVLSLLPSLSALALSPSLCVAPGFRFVSVSLLSDFPYILHLRICRLLCIPFFPMKDSDLFFLPMKDTNIARACTSAGPAHSLNKRRLKARPTVRLPLMALRRCTPTAATTLSTAIRISILCRGVLRHGGCLGARESH